jgi:hypothetical protein
MTHQNNFIITNSIKILNTIIDGGTKRDSNTNRSTSMHNLHHLHNSNKFNFNFSSESSSKSMSLSHPSLSLLTPRSATISGDRSPLWTALTTAQVISIDAEYMDDDS